MMTVTKREDGSNFISSPFHVGGGTERKIKNLMKTHGLIENK